MLEKIWRFIYCQPSSRRSIGRCPTHQSSKKSFVLFVSFVVAFGFPEKDVSSIDA